MGTCASGTYHKTLLITDLLFHLPYLTKNSLEVDTTLPCPGKGRGEASLGKRWCLFWLTLLLCALASSPSSPKLHFPVTGKNCTLKRVPASRDQKGARQWGKILVEDKGKLNFKPCLVICAHKGKDQSSSLCKESYLVRQTTQIGF